MSQKAKDILLKITVNVCRLILASTFIFSGFVKANDPYGTAYKLIDYLNAWSVHLPEAFALFGAVILATIELVIGLYLFFGISRRPIARITTVLMGFMTLFSVYIAIFNPVSDCGCFGDAIILTNTETLLKNIVLMGASIMLWKYYELQIRFLSKNTEWLISIFSNIYALALAGYSIVYLPVIDFRPYHIGADVRRGIEIPEEERPQFENKIVYERDGEILELGLDEDDPDSTWTYVETKRVMIKEGGKALMSNFYIIDQSKEDITQAIVEDEGYSFLLIAPQIENATQGFIGDINEIYDYATENGYGFYCVTSSDTTAQKSWIDHTGAEYSIYNGDERILKTVVRSNPGLVLLKDGKIIKKRSTYNLPDQEQLTKPLENLDFGKIDHITTKRKISNIILLFILPLLTLTMLDRIAAGWSFYRNFKRKSKDFQLENIERALGIEKTTKVNEQEVTSNTK